MPNEVARADQTQRAYLAKQGSVMLMDYAKREIELKERVVVETEHWLAVVPYWAVWPFETLLMPKAHVKRLTDLTEEQSKDLALVLKKLTTKYDNLFETSFPYSMGFHAAPLMKRAMNIGNFMPIFIHHYYVLLLYVNLW